MDNISFLSDKDDNMKKKRKKEEEAGGVEWSTPEDGGTSGLADGKQTGNGETGVSAIFSFFKKEKTAAIPPHEQLERSRREVLRAINEHEAREKIASASAGGRESRLSEILKMFARKDKGVSVDLKADFEEEEKKKKKKEKEKEKEEEARKKEEREKQKEREEREKKEKEKEEKERREKEKKKEEEAEKKEEREKQKEKEEREKKQKDKEEKNKKKEEEAEKKEEREKQKEKGEREKKEKPVVEAAAKAVAAVMSKVKGAAKPLMPPPADEKDIDFAYAVMPETKIEPYRINLFNRLIDWWNRKKKEGEEEAAADEEKTGRPQSDSEEQDEEDAGDKDADIAGKNGRIAALKEDAGAEGGKNSGKNKYKEEKNLEDSDVLETNLMEGESISFFDWKKNGTVLAASVALSLIAVGLAYGGLYVWGNGKRTQISAFEKRIEELNVRLKQAQGDAKQLSALEKKIKLADTLLSRHIYWTNFFRFLEDKTIADVYYKSFMGDNGGKYLISGRARNFNSLTEQLKVLKADKDKVVQASITGGKLGTSDKDKTTGVEFGLDITLHPGIFLKP